MRWHFDVSVKRLNTHGVEAGWDGLGSCDGVWLASRVAVVVAAAATTCPISSDAFTTSKPGGEGAPSASTTCHWRVQGVKGERYVVNSKSKQQAVSSE